MSELEARESEESERVRMGGLGSGVRGSGKIVGRGGSGCLMRMRVSFGLGAREEAREEARPLRRSQRRGTVWPQILREISLRVPHLVELFEAARLDHLHLPGNGDGAAVELSIELCVVVVQVDAFDGGELLNVEDVLGVDSSRVGNERRLHLPRLQPTPVEGGEEGLTLHLLRSLARQ